MRLLRSVAPGLLVVILGCSSSDDGSLKAAGPGGDTGGPGPSASGDDAAADGGGPAGDDAGDDSTEDGGNDAGGKDGGKDGGPGAGCGALAYCEGFESYSGAIADGAKLGAWTATVSATGATMTIDSTKAYAGKNSLHIVAAKASGPGTRGILKQTVAAGLVAGNDLWGRVMVYYGNAAGDGLPTIHSWLFEADGHSTPTNQNVGANLGSRNTNMAINFSPSDKTTPPGGGNLTAGKWHCIQWQYDGSGNPVKNIANVWVDGKLAVNVNAAGGFIAATPFTTMAFGFTHYQTVTDAADVYLDEFAVDKAKIPCN